jgi:PAS domain-containing protein
MLPTDSRFFELLTSSYLRLVGKTLLPRDLVTKDPPCWLYEDAGFCVLAHDTEADPRFVYANRAAQMLFEYSWDEFIGLPSRLSAEPAEQSERQHLLDQVAQHGFASNYAGIRISKTGRRFWIEDGTVWQLIDAGGTLQGQAAVFKRWRAA